jgi:hypothetical protein
MNELKELAERLEWDWKENTKHFEIIKAEKWQDKWYLIVQEMKKEEGKENEKDCKTE